MKQRIVTGFLAAALVASTFAAQAQTYIYPNSNGLYVSPYYQPSPNVIVPYTAAPVAPNTYAPLGDNPWTTRVQPTVPYTPPPPVVDYGQIMMQDYIWNGRR